MNALLIGVFGVVVEPEMRVESRSERRSTVDVIIELQSRRMIS